MENNAVIVQQVTKLLLKAGIIEQVLESKAYPHVLLVEELNTTTKKKRLCIDYRSSNECISHMNKLTVTDHFACNGQRG
jgi:hypothetical protein